MRTLLALYAISNSQTPVCRHVAHQQALGSLLNRLTDLLTGNHLLAGLLASQHTLAPAAGQLSDARLLHASSQLPGLLCRGAPLRLEDQAVCFPPLYPPPKASVHTSLALSLLPQKFQSHNEATPYQSAPSRAVPLLSPLWASSLSSPVLQYPGMPPRLVFLKLFFIFILPKQLSKSFLPTP